MVLGHTGVKRPFDVSEESDGRRFYCLIETSGSNAEHDAEVR